MAALDAVPVERITARARQARPGRAALAVIGGILFCVGWVVAKTFRVAWLAVVWCAFAVAEGWQSARKDERRSRGPGRAG